MRSLGRVIKIELVTNWTCVGHTMSNLVQQLHQLRNYTDDEPVKIHHTKHLTMDVLESYLQEACELNLQKVVIIYDDIEVSNKKITTFKNIYDLTIFDARNLTLLLRSHRLSPKFQKLPKSDQQRILNQYNGVNLPKISKQDPQCILYGLDLDEVIEIHRKRGVYYRIVVDD